MNNPVINVANDFYPRPAGRYEKDGAYNGERFRKQFLVPKLKSLSKSEQIIIDFQGVTMAGSSFLEEAFGGLVREEGFNKDFLLNAIDVRSPRAIIKTRIETYINEAH